MKDLFIKFSVFILLMGILTTFVACSRTISNINSVDNSSAENTTDEVSEKETFDTDVTEYSDYEKDITEAFMKAELVASYYTGFAKDVYTDGTVDIQGIRYDRFSVCDTLDELYNMTREVFDEKLTDTLMSTPAGTNRPLYVEQDGKLYRYGGYVALKSYDDSFVRITGYSGDEDFKTIKTEIILINDTGDNQAVEREYSLIKGDDGKWRMTGDYVLPIMTTFSDKYSVTADGFVMYPTFKEMAENLPEDSNVLELYTYEKVEKAVDIFLNPEKYKNELEEERYNTLKDLKIGDYYFTYDPNIDKIFINFSVSGTPFSNVSTHYNRREIATGMQGAYVACGDIGLYKSDAATALDKYLRMAGTYKFPEDYPDNTALLSEYTVSCLEESGIPATYENIVSYGNDYLGITLTELPENLIYNEETGTYWFGGHGTRSMPYLIIGEYIVPSDGSTNLTVRYYSDFSCQLESHLYQYRLKRTGNGWKLISSTMDVYSPYEPGNSSVG